MVGVARRRGNAAGGERVVRPARGRGEGAYRWSPGLGEKIGVLTEVRSAQIWRSSRRRELGVAGFLAAAGMAAWRPDGEDGVDSRRGRLGVVGKLARSCATSRRSGFGVEEARGHLVGRGNGGVSGGVEVSRAALLPGRRWRGGSEGKEGEEMREERERSGGHGWP